MEIQTTVPARLPERVRGRVTVSIDLEDWHQLVTRRWSGQSQPCSRHVEEHTDRVLELLDAHDIRGTFFVLGLVAQAKPALVKRIAERGHEIASHGESHVRLHDLGRDEIARELADSRNRLSDLSGTDVVGFRAPEFSIDERNLWVLEEVAAAGYRYDSSIYPIRHRRYGISTFPRSPCRVPLPSRRVLYELPIGTFPTRYGNLPIGGGGYFRLFPGAVLDGAVQTLTRRGEHTSLYFHPYEFTREPLVVDTDVLPTRRGARMRARAWFAMQSLGRSRLPGRLERVLRHAKSIRAVDVVEALESSEPSGTNAEIRLECT